MNKNYTRLYDTDVSNSSTSAKGKSGNWHGARPLRYKSIFVNIRNAWHVFIGRADALYWRIDDDL